MNTEKPKKVQKASTTATITSFKNSIQKLGEMKLITPEEQKQLLLIKDNVVEKFIKTQF